MTKRQKLSERIISLVGAGVLASAVIGLVGWGVWRLVCLIPVNTLRALFILAVLAIPTAAAAGWYFGATEARGRLAGIDQAVDKVMVAAVRTVGIQTTARASMRTPDPTPYAVLPDVQIVPRQIGPGDVIDL